MGVVKGPQNIEIWEKELTFERRGTPLFLEEREREKDTCEISNLKDF